MISRVFLLKSRLPVPFFGLRKSGPVFVGIPLKGSERGWRVWVGVFAWLMNQGVSLGHF